MISFIVGTNNRPEELQRFIDHLKDQTSQDYEIIVADEGDNGWVRDKYPEVKYFAHPFAGDWHYTAKNKAAALAEGDFLCFPQDDAYFFPRFVELMQQANLNVCGWIWGDQGRKKMPPSTEVCRVDIGGFTVRKELFDGFENTREGLSDGKFVHKYAAYAKLIPEVLYDKR